MECLKQYHDLALLSERLQVPFLTHFYARFDPAKSKALASSIANFHLRDLESADYRSAYHMLCDWFYGWNVTDGDDAGVGAGAADTSATQGAAAKGRGTSPPSGAAGTGGAGGAGPNAGEFFRMRRVPRDIDIREEGERVECDRICKTYETLLALSRRILKRYYLDIEELLPKIGDKHEIGPDGQKAFRDEGDGNVDLDKVWNYTRSNADDDDPNGMGRSREGSSDSLDKEMEDLLNMSRAPGMVVRKKNLTGSKRDLAGGSRRASVMRKLGSSADVLGGGSQKASTNDLASSTQQLNEGDSSNRRQAVRDASSKLDSAAEEPPGGSRGGTVSTAASAPVTAQDTAGGPSVRKGVLHEALGEEDVRRGIQRDINHVYVQLDKSTDYTLVCLSTAFCILTFSQMLGNQEVFLKYSAQAQELSMDFVSNTLKVVWDLLNRELPNELSLQDLRHPELLRIQFEKIIELRRQFAARPTAGGQAPPAPRYRWRKLYRKFALLHEIFTSVDAHLFPNFLVAHKDGVKAAKYSAFDSCLWLTAGYDCIIRIHDIRPPAVMPIVAAARAAAVAGIAIEGSQAAVNVVAGADGDGSKPPGTAAPTTASLAGPAGGTTGHTCLAQYVGHKSIVTDVHFTRDDTHIVSSSFDRTVKIWNAQSASCERTLRGHLDAVTTCDVSADGRHVASGSTDCTIRLWDITTGDCIAVIKKHSRWVKVVRFSHDGRFLITAGLDKRIYVWDLKILINSKAISHTRCIEAHTDYILDMATARPSLLATTSRDSTVRLFDYVTGQELAVFDLQPSWACTICFSDDGQYLATGSFDNNVVIFRVKDASRVRQIRVLNLGIFCVRFPRDLSYIVVGSTEGFLQQIPL
ncbi:WD40-repeat-containing domain protein [Fimicolochytrium jonesii]|uniref:WD40-repeat-containing domain protein n=1 Tax=Fimicolochytrium jonesii TaxID=1396493 RepID=UPI0022FDB0F1|nr:WD40-repeat-containing domain protein [Fimicolochytrium jonesii]KAI8816427.1 WD40-repeat-containing domain protein [Fimicolochytrium jonesii]